MVIDTVKDVVVGDIGDEIMSTSGVAVRPFWWSKECLQVLGLATGDSGSHTTAAGDTFCGYLVAGLVEGMTLLEATRLATSAAAISVTRSGSVSSIPHRFEVDPQRPTHP